MLIKKLLSIIVASLLWCNISLAQEFYPNKELDIDELINFDLTKYKFTDYKKIIGSKVKSWNGDTQRIGKGSKDWKAINVKINNEPYELRLNHLDTGGINLFILIRGLSCEAAKSIIPAKYIREENTLSYASDFDELGKLYIEEFSFDTNKNTRLISGCIAMLDAYNQGDVEDVTYTINLYPQDETDEPQVVPLKMIRCKTVKYKNKYKLDSNNKITLNQAYTPMPETNDVTLDYYISDSESQLLTKKFRVVGNKTFRFDRDMIHTEKRYKLDKTKVDRLFIYEDYKIDRIYGDFYFNKREYDKNHVSALTPNNEKELQYKGNCVKKDIKERAF